MNDFKWRHFQGEIILWAARSWIEPYFSFSLSSSRRARLARDFNFFAVSESIRNASKVAIMLFSVFMDHH